MSPFHMATTVPAPGLLAAVKTPLLLSMVPMEAGRTDQSAPEPQGLAPVRWTVWPTVRTGAAGSILRA